MEWEEEEKGTYWPRPAENVRQWTGPRNDNERSQSKGLRDLYQYGRSTWIFGG